MVATGTHFERRFLELHTPRNASSRGESFGCYGKPGRDRVTGCPQQQSESLVLYRRLWSAQDEALHLSRAHSDAAGMLLPHRAASTPVAGADLLAGPGRVSKRSWEEAAAASAAAPGLLFVWCFTDAVLYPTTRTETPSAHSLVDVHGKVDTPADEQDHYVWPRNSWTLMPSQDAEASRWSGRGSTGF